MNRITRFSNDEADASIDLHIGHMLSTLLFPTYTFHIMDTKYALVHGAIITKMYAHVFFERAFSKAAIIISIPCHQRHCRTVDNLSKQFGARSGPPNVDPDLDNILL